MKVIPNPTRLRRPWTQKEDERLLAEFARVDLDQLAEALERSPVAVSKRAQRLGVGSPQTLRGTRTLTDLARATGYATSTLRAAARELGFLVDDGPAGAYRAKVRLGGSLPLAQQRLVRVARTDVRQKRQRHVSRCAWAITLPQEEAILALLRASPGHRFYPRTPGRGKSPKGVWGTGKKPACCEGCQSADRPHFARGRCARCYDALRRLPLAAK